MTQLDRAKGLIVQFAKAPIVGQVKTRLYSALTPDDATALHCALVKHSHQMLKSLDNVQNALAVAPLEHDFWRQEIFSGTPLWPQPVGDLGRRMHACFKSHLQGGVNPWVIVIGSDCPSLSPAYLASVITALEMGQQLVLGPASDGGYVLIAMASPLPVFDGVDWGTSQVLAQTCANADLLGITPYLLAPLADVDRPEDLAQLRQYADLSRWSGCTSSTF